MIYHRPENVLLLFSRWYHSFNEIEKSCSFTFLATAVVRLWAKGRSCTLACQAFIPSDCGSGLCLLVRQHDWKCKYLNGNVISELVFPKCEMQCVIAIWVCISTHPLQADFQPLFFLLNFHVFNRVYIYKLCVFFCINMRVEAKISQNSTLYLYLSIFASTSLLKH